MNRCPRFPSVVLEVKGVFMARAWYGDGTLKIMRFVFSKAEEDGDFQNWIDSQVMRWLLFGNLKEPPELWRFERVGEFEAEVVH